VGDASAFKIGEEFLRRTVDCIEKPSKEEAKDRQSRIANFIMTTGNSTFHAFTSNASLLL